MFQVSQNMEYKSNSAVLNWMFFTVCVILNAFFDVI